MTGRRANPRSPRRELPVVFPVSVCKLRKKLEVRQEILFLQTLEIKGKGVILRQLSPASVSAYYSPPLVCSTQLYRASGMLIRVRRGACTPCLAVVVLSGAGGGGSVTQELSHNQSG